MEEKLMESLGRAPELLAMVIIVVAFLKFMKSERESNDKRGDERTKEFVACTKEMTANNTEIFRASQAQMERYAHTQAENTNATRDLTTAMRSTCKYNGNPPSYAHDRT